MGWKSLKNEYRIDHHVQVREGRIAIGSGYVSDLIRVSFDGVVTWGSLGTSKDDDLARYYEEMTADLERLKRLVQQEDVFEVSLPVWTYEGAEIIEKRCEAYGWPNVTHDGLMMYENTFSADRNEVVKWAKRSAASLVKSYDRLMKEALERVEQVGGWLRQAQEDVSKLAHDWPEQPGTANGEPGTEHEHAEA